MLKTPIKRLRVQVSKNKEAYAAQYLTLLNGVMKLHPRQLEVLIAIAQRGNLVTTDVRKDIRKELNFRSPDALNMVISDLKKKSVLQQRDKRGELEINSYLKPERYGSLVFEFYESD